MTMTDKLPNAINITSIEEEEVKIDDSVNGSVDITNECMGYNNASEYNNSNNSNNSNDMHNYNNSVNDTSISSNKNDSDEGVFISNENTYNENEHDSIARNTDKNSTTVDDSHSNVNDATGKDNTNKKICELVGDCTDNKESTKKSTKTDHTNISNKNNETSNTTLNLQNLLDNTFTNDTFLETHASTPVSESDSAYIDELNFLEGRKVGKYRVTKNLGSGASSRVKLGINVVSGEKVAIKIIKRDRHPHSTSESQKRREDRIYREVLISSLLCHPHIVRLKNFYYNENYFYLVFEYVKGCQLLDIVLLHGALKERDARRYFRQLLSAVSYIHENSVVHRDLKIENILVNEHGNVKLLDFGLSNFYDCKKQLGTFCGSLYFAAPELLMGRKYGGPEIDVWSLGIVLYVLVCGKVPFDDKDIHVLHAKIKEATLQFSKNVSKDCKSLLSDMIQGNAETRHDLQKVIESEWVNKGYKTKIDNFLCVRYSLESVNDKLVHVLSVVLKEQFPMLKNEIKKYADVCASTGNNFERNFWFRKPVISLYYLLYENFVTNKFSNTNDTINEVYLNNPARERESDEDEKPENMHNFVNFLFTKEKENAFSRYFFGSVFIRDESSAFLPENEATLREEFDAESEKQPTPKPVILLPKIKRSFIKGIFKGIYMNNLSCQEKLRKIVQNWFVNNGILFAVNDRHYVCSIGDGRDYCSFKVSLYLNTIFDGYYLSVTRLAGDKKKYKSMTSMLKDMARKCDSI